MNSKQDVFQQSLPRDIWGSTYKWDTDNTVQDTWRRNAKFIASAEKTEALKSEWEDKFYDLLSDFKFVGGGRITANAGTDLNTTLINCFVDSLKSPNLDSLDEIYNALHRQAIILKSEGGYGICIDGLRPRGGFVAGIGHESPGAVAMLDLWDTSSSVITSGSGRKVKNSRKIRKGAMMVTMTCWHPSIEEFITAKRTPGKLTKFNMSVLVTDNFINAVKSHSKWDLEFPDTTFMEYDPEWDGDLTSWKNKGYPTIIWKTFNDATELWDLIMTSTFNHSEPGVLFIDRINDLNNLSYIERLSSTNPCGL